MIRPLAAIPLVASIIANWFSELFHIAPNAVNGLDWQNPWAFWLLFLLPVWLLWYRYQQSRFWENAFRFTPLAVVEHLEQAPSGIKRLFFPLWMLSLQLLLVLGLARPVISGSVPTLQVNLMLVMDISLSMLADDIEPNRLEAAKRAAIRFVDSLPGDVRIGLELFAGNNYVIQSPTKNHDDVAAYIESLSERHLQMRTEIGSALKTAVEVLSSGSMAKGQSPVSDKAKQVIVLMSDGDSQEGYPWSAAVSMARETNISVYTIGVGSTGEASIVYQGRRVPVSFNENILRQIASVSGGQFYRVASADEFSKVYEQVKQQSVVMEHREEEITWLIILLALAIFLTGSPLIRSRL